MPQVVRVRFHLRHTDDMPEMVPYRRHASSGACSVALEAYRQHASSGTSSVPFEAYNVYDIEGGYAEALQQLFARHADNLPKINAGKYYGDITSVPLLALVEVDVLIGQGVSKPHTSVYFPEHRLC